MAQRHEGHGRMHVAGGSSGGRAGDTPPSDGWEQQQQQGRDMAPTEWRPRTALMAWMEVQTMTCKTLEAKQRDGRARVNAMATSFHCAEGQVVDKQQQPTNTLLPWLFVD